MPLAIAPAPIARELSLLAKDCAPIAVELIPNARESVPMAIALASIADALLPMAIDSSPEELASAPIAVDFSLVECASDPIAIDSSPDATALTSANESSPFAVVYEPMLIAPWEVASELSPTLIVELLIAAALFPIVI